MNRQSEGKSRGIPHLAKDERDVGHPSLVAEWLVHCVKSGNLGKLGSWQRIEILRRAMRSRREFLVGAGVLVAGAAATPLALAKKSDLIENTSPAAAVQPSSRKDVMCGLMVDAARAPETMAYYKRVIEFCADWELNTLQFRLTDDQGSAMHFTSVPNLVTHRNALTAEELKSLVEYGQSHGVELIPEVESFGHTGYITRSPAYAHLSDRDASGDVEFNGIIPVNPETLTLFGKLYGEVAAIFPSSYLHGGCDEVNWGGSSLSRKALQGKGRARVWAEYLNSLNEISAGLGKQLIVWGDFVVHKEPEVLGQLNKKIIIMDWNYSDNSSAKFLEAFQKVSANGSRGIGAPALTCYKWGARVGGEQLRNVDACVDAYSGTNDPNALGVIVTNWVPSRYIQASIWDEFAYAAVALKKGTAIAQTSGFRRFVEKHYQSDWNVVWDEVFQTIYDQAPYRKDQETSAWMGLLLPVPWSDDEQLTALLKKGSPQPNPFTRIRSLLVQLEPQVVRNFSDFQAFELCVEYLEKMFWRETVVIEQAQKRPLQREAADLLIQSIAERDRDIAGALTRDWDKGRFPDAAAKQEPVVDLEPQDQLLYQWNRAAAYSASLASQPNRFYQLIEAAKRQ
jgi:Glycosyl hydrolase family 20, catalytic domain